MKAKLTIVALCCHCAAFAQPAARYDILVTEIMANPAPAVGLPNAKYIELRNVSVRPFNLNGWKISIASGATATITQQFLLQPDSFVVLCPRTAATAFSAWGAVIGLTGFPSLSSGGDQVILRSVEDKTIHAVEYDISWYRNELKSGGGWSLEMTDHLNPCGGYANWQASTSVHGGTPGRANTVAAANADHQPPSLRHSFAGSAGEIILVFDEPLDSAVASIAANYSIAGEPAARKATVLPPFFNRVVLQLAAPLVQNRPYTVTVANVTDCSGNRIGSNHTVKTGWASAAGASDIVINEVLFNPRPGGAGYVELYNRSERIIDLRELSIANRSSSGTIASIKPVSVQNRLFFPGGYLVITKDGAAVQDQYLVKDPGTLTVLKAMPSYPKEKGTVIVLDAQGLVADEFSYHKDMHFKLVNNDEGIALERIDYNRPAAEAANWHSAATSAGYGTPGYRNSQFRATGIDKEFISISPAVFSPDNDGFDDFATVGYRFPETGYVCNITVFDAAGRPVRQLVRNALCGKEGYFRWDGLNEQSAKLPIGVYVVYTEVFNLQGKTRRFRHAVTIARRL